jgi:hypothetical protein
MVNTELLLKIDHGVERILDSSLKIDIPVTNTENLEN